MLGTEIRSDQVVLDDVTESLIQSRLDEAEARGLHNGAELGGLLHDVGKIGVPEAVLNKEGKLDDVERETIQRHAKKSAEIVSNIENINRLVNADMVTQAVRHHHERFDGKGYPDGLAGDRIPLAARILAIADTYDAITSDRSYRNGREGRVAAGIISECSGTQFDPYCVAAFLRAFEVGIIEKAADWRSRFHLATTALEPAA